MATNSAVQDIEAHEVSLRALRAAAMEHFQPLGAKISGIQAQHIPGVPVLGSLMPHTFGPVTFDTFTVTLPKDEKGREATYEVTERRGEAGRFEVVNTVIKPSRWMPGNAVVENQDMKKQLDYRGARAALGL